MAPRILKFGERHIKHHPKQMERARRENEGVRGRQGGNYGEEKRGAKFCLSSLLLLSTSIRAPYCSRVNSPLCCCSPHFPLLSLLSLSLPWAAAAFCRCEQPNNNNADEGSQSCFRLNSFDSWSARERPARRCTWPGEDSVSAPSSSKRAKWHLKSTITWLEVMQVIM